MVPTIPRAAWAIVMGPPTGFRDIILEAFLNGQDAAFPGAPEGGDKRPACAGHSSIETNNLRLSAGHPNAIHRGDSL